VELEIVPEPDAAERAAIVAAVEGAAPAPPAASPWADTALPERYAAEEPGP
jgi:hypothetical protein